MPSYDYCCKRCGACFEAHHPMSAQRPPCPQCGAGVERIFLHAPAVHGHMTRGREMAAQTLEPSTRKHGPQCPCCY
ncbi:MAG: FmdB family zinc ribbon protein [Methylohalobius sp. ZOD2]